MAVLDTEIFVRDSIESMTVAEKQLNVQREISTSDYPANRKSGSFSRESITENGCLGCEVAMELKTVAKLLTVPLKVCSQYDLSLPRSTFPTRVTTVRT